MIGPLKKKKSTGSALIHEVIGKFDQLITDLNEGVEHCSTQRNKISEQIKQLQADDAVLQTDITRAVNVREKLQNLIA